jgi:hypothetical protein
MEGMQSVNAKHTNRPTFEIRPVQDRQVTQQTVDRLEESGASPELMVVAQRAVKRSTK